MNITPIAHIQTDFTTKFGIPRQSTIIDELEGVIVFEPEYRSIDSINGLQDFSHIWLLWDFSENHSSHFNATVRPPRLGGNTRVGVFATRSPFRPNSIGLSCVKLKKIVTDSCDGPLLYVSGIDMLNNTPIYDIKPYIPLSDCITSANGGFTETTKSHQLKVNITKEQLALLPEKKQAALFKILSQDPRPGYHDDPSRVYGFNFANYEINFYISNDTLTVTSIIAL